MPSFCRCGLRCLARVLFVFVVGSPWFWPRGGLSAQFLSSAVALLWPELVLAAPFCVLRSLCVRSDSGFLFRDGVPVDVSAVVVSYDCKYVWCLQCECCRWMYVAAHCHNLLPLCDKRVQYDDANVSVVWCALLCNININSMYRSCMCIRLRNVCVLNYLINLRGVCFPITTVMWLLLENRQKLLLCL